jgi:hypothetical protein
MCQPTQSNNAANPLILYNPLIFRADNFIAGSLVRCKSKAIWLSHGQHIGKEVTMTSKLKVLVSAVGFAALLATPVMAKSHGHHRGFVAAGPAHARFGAPAGIYRGRDWQLEGRLPVPDLPVPYRY